MDKEDEIISNDESSGQLDPGIQALADMADKMGKDNHESEYNEFGFNSEGMHKNGTRYDEEGYGEDGFDKDGVDREGFDREGLGTDYRDRDGYNRIGFDNEGYNRRGFNKEGIHKNGTRYDHSGLDASGYGMDGYDTFGYNRDGRDREGRDRRGFDELGYDKSGHDRFGYDREGFDKDGYNRRGFDRQGFNIDGFNEGGFDREGYNLEGYDSEGYNREGVDREGCSREFNVKFNQYGVDENGYMKNGELDSDIEFAISFSESGIKDQIKYAAEKGMDEKEVRERIESARKKCPNIDEIIKNILLTGNKMRVAAISDDCEKFISGELDMNGFWGKHPRLNISEVLSSFINDPEKRKQFSDRTVENLVLDSDNIEGNLRVFGTSQYDVSGALKGIEDFKRIYTGFGTDGTPEQIQKKRENTKKIFDTIKYLNRYRNRNLDSLLGSRQSFDGGRTWIEFNGETIGQAMDALKKDKKLICVQTVKDYIVNQFKNPNDNS